MSFEVFERALGSLFWAGVVPLTLQALFLLLLFALIDRLLPRAAWPEARALALTLLLLKLLLPPALGSPWFWFGATQLRAFELSRFDEGRLRAWALGLAWVWLAGVFVGLLCWLWRHHTWMRLWRGATSAGAEVTAMVAQVATRLELNREPAVRIKEGLESPCVFGVDLFGFGQARVLLPAGLEAATLEHVLLHELAHVKRRDPAWAALVNVVRLMHFFNPLVLLAARRLESLRELCCDRFVARRLGREVDAYRSTLLAFAAQRHQVGLASLGLPFFGRASLIDRLRALERAHDRPATRRWAQVVAAAFALILCVPFTPAAERKAHEVAELITKPAGCLPLRYLVLSRLAAERLQEKPTTEGTEKK